MSESTVAAMGLTNTLAWLMTEPQPLARPLKRLKRRGEWPIDDALLLFEAAVEYVAVQHAARVVGCWECRQRTLNGWRETLRHVPGPISLEAVADSGRVHRVELEAVLVGTGYWQYLVDDIDELLWLRARRHEETEHMHRVVASARERLAMIIKRCVERRAEISATTQARLQAISPEATAAQESVMESAYPDLIVLSETAYEQINAQTRRVLDTYRSTAALPIWQFWEMAYKDLIEG
jgi:hypothetical protein